MMKFEELRTYKLQVIEALTEMSRGISDKRFSEANLYSWIMDTENFEVQKLRTIISREWQAAAHKRVVKKWAEERFTRTVTITIS